MRGRLLAAVALLGALVGCAVPALGPGRARHVVIISIDGLRPEFYLDDSWAAPELRALLKAGSHARAAEGVFPTVTYPNHATIVTGVRPARHGIFSNTIPTPAGTRGRWHEEVTDLRASPIWEWARAAGLTTAAVSWPVTSPSSGCAPTARWDLRAPGRDAEGRDVQGHRVVGRLPDRDGYGDDPAGPPESAARAFGPDRLLPAPRRPGGRRADALGAMPNAAFAIAAAPGVAMGFGCRGPLLVPGSGGQHGYLPSHPRMPTGFIAAGAGVRAGVALERVQLVDIAPTAARLLRLAPPDVEGRVLSEILE